MNALFGSTSPRSLAIALQGGGAHGAFSWGVLDALLEDGRFDIKALSGTSSGAMNAVVMANGLTRGASKPRSQRLDLARGALADFWLAISAHCPKVLVQGEAATTRLSPAGQLLMDLTHWLSPYQYNPLELNPLRDVVQEHVDFKQLRRHSLCQLFVAATQTNTGRLKVFRETHLTADHLLASACLPTLHHAVQVGSESYWDGGYSANPAVSPLLHDTRIQDVLLVLLAPLRHENTPRSAPEISIRMAELGFTAPLLREMQMLAEASQIAHRSLFSLGPLERRLRQLKWHLIEASDLSAMQRSETKLIAADAFVTWLRDQGRVKTHQWLTRHASDVGRRSTVDVAHLFG